MATPQALAKEAPQATVTLKRTFAVPRERVFKVWTEPEHLVNWWGPPGTVTPEAKVDLRPGGSYRLTMRKLPDGEPFYLTGTYREVKPPERLVYTWTWEGSTMQVKDSVVTVEFLDRGGSTEVILTHALLPSDEARAAHTHGWTGCFDRLAEWLQKSG